MHHPNCVRISGCHGAEDSFAGIADEFRIALQRAHFIEAVAVVDVIGAEFVNQLILKLELSKSGLYQVKGTSLMKREPISVNNGSPGCRNEGLNDDIESFIEH